MTCIFYDLETTSQDPVGQILNYCFLLVGKDFEPLDECSGLITISPLELPRVGAILANRVDVLEHQRRANESEREAMCRIAQFIEQGTRRARGKLPLIGFNSSRFDLPFLRTSFIRNGVQPYFYGKLIYRDLLFVARKLSCTRADFPRSAYGGGDTNKLSLKLETLTQALGLLTGKQEHESRFDVDLTVSLARHFRDHFSLDVRSYEPYEALPYVSKRSKKTPLILEALSPEYDLASSEIAIKRPLCLLDSDSTNRSALWIDLEHFAVIEGEGGDLQKSLRWLRAEHSQCIVGRDLSEDKSLQHAARNAENKLSHISLSNYFSRPSCDIEQHIFRIHEKNNFRPLEALCASIEKNDRAAVNDLGNSDASVLFTRYRLRHASPKSRKQQSFEKIAKNYYRYRYGGDMQLSRAISDTSEARYHPTLRDLYSELSEANRAHSDCQDDVNLIASLKSLYENSEPCELCPELKENPVPK